MAVSAAAAAAGLSESLGAAGRFRYHPAFAAAMLGEAHAARVIAPGLVSADPLCAPFAPSQQPCSFVHLRPSLGGGLTGAGGGLGGLGGGFGFGSDAPFDGMVTSRCRSCGQAFVPSVLLATIEPPASLPTSPATSSSRLCGMRRGAARG